MTDKVGWEVEGFINRLTQRDETNSERLVLEAVSHLRAFSRDCDGLLEQAGELRAEIEQLKADRDIWKSRYEKLQDHYAALEPKP